MQKKLLAVLLTLFEEAASSKTRRYVVDRNDFKNRLDQAVATMEGLRTTHGKFVTVDGDVYSVEEYYVPEKLVNVLNSGWIYASVDAMGKVEPIRRERGVSIPMTPVAFNAFWNDINSNQPDEGRIKLTQMKREDLTLEDLSYLEDENGSMRKLHENGICNIEESWLIGFNVKELESFLPEYQAPSNSGVAKWLLSR